MYAYCVDSSHIKSVMSVYGCNMNLELQQRAVEYNSILKHHDNLRDGLFEQMPPIELKNYAITNGNDAAASAASGDAEPNARTSYHNNNSNEEELRKQKEEAAKTLIDIFGDEPAESAETTPAAAKPAYNLLDDLLDGGDVSAPPPVAATSTAKTSNDLDDLFSFGAASTTPSTATTNDLLFGNASAPAAAAAATTTSNVNDMLDFFGGGQNAPAPPTKSHTSNNLMDDLFGTTAAAAAAPAPPTPAVASHANDMLDIFGGLPTTTQAPRQPQQQQLISDIDLMFGSPTPAKQSSSATATAAASSLTVYDKNNLKIVLEAAARGAHSNAQQHFIQMQAYNQSLTHPVRDFLFSAAVPKSMQLQLSQPTTNVILPLESMSQTIAIANPKQVIHMHRFCNLQIRFGALVIEHKNNVML